MLASLKYPKQLLPARNVLTRRRSGSSWHSHRAQVQRCLSSKSWRSQSRRQSFHGSSRSPPVSSVHTRQIRARGVLEERMNANLAGQVFRLMILICANLSRESAAAVASDSQCGGSLWNFTSRHSGNLSEMAFLQFVDQFRQSMSALQDQSWDIDSGRDGDPTRSLVEKNNSILTYFNPRLGTLTQCKIRRTMMMRMVVAMMVQEREIMQ